MKNQVHLITALILGVAMLSIPTLATALEVTVNVLGQASLVAHGAGVNVSVDVTCSDDFNPNPTVFIAVDLIQRTSGQRTNFGEGALTRRPIICDNEPNRFTVTVEPRQDRVFKKGSALAEASADVCKEDGFTCSFPRVHEEIRIR